MLYKHNFKQFELCKLHVLSSTKISVPQSPMTNLIQTDEENSQAVIKTVTPQILRGEDCKSTNCVHLLKMTEFILYLKQRMKYCVCKIDYEISSHDEIYNMRANHILVRFFHCHLLIAIFKPEKNRYQH